MPGLGVADDLGKKCRSVGDLGGGAQASELIGLGSGTRGEHHTVDRSRRTPGPIAQCSRPSIAPFGPRLLSGSQEILIYGVLPLSYLFQTVDVAMIALFGAFGIIEAARALRSNDDD